MKARLDAQEREIRELKEMLRTGIPTAAPADPKQANGPYKPAQPPAGSAPAPWEVKSALPPGTIDGDVAIPCDKCDKDKSGKDKAAADIRIQYDPNPQSAAHAGLILDIATPDFPRAENGDYPFEWRMRGRIQTDYYNYQTNDTINHLTNVNTHTRLATDQSEFEIKRMRLIFAGYMFTPDLRFQIQLDGNTRGLATEDTRGNFYANPIGNVEGGQNISNVDSGMRLLEAWIAYDLHGDADVNGYRNTLTFIAGKQKPLGSLEEYLRSENCQFVEFGMASWMFDSDADNYIFGAGIHVKAFEDRLFFMALLTNAADNQVPDYNLDNIPGAIINGWYDFGGTWDENTKRWKLFGPSLSDINWSENPVLRVGGGVDINPMGRRSQYTTAQLDFYSASSAAPGGTNVDSILGGGGLNVGGTGGIGAFGCVATGNSPFAVDAFDAYTSNFYWAFHYQGFSFYNEWWVRELTNFRGLRNPTGNGNLPILYTTNTAAGASSAALFNTGGLTDIGMALQSGYFLIPHKLELAARWDVISGDSGDINGNGTSRSVSSTTLGIKQSALVGGVQPANTVPLGTNIKIVNSAFTHYHESQEIAVGLNVFFYNENVKWQTDVGMYTGGNPAANGQSPAGYIPGVNGYLVRTQIQLFF